MSNNDDQMAPIFTQKIEAILLEKRYSDMIMDNLSLHMPGNKWLPDDSSPLAAIYRGALNISLKAFWYV